MSNSMSAIKYDMDFYVDLCRKFNEPIQYTRDYYGVLLVDCYGIHANKLIKKNQEQQNGRY